MFKSKSAKWSTKILHKKDTHVYRALAFNSQHLRGKQSVLHQLSTIQILKKGRAKTNFDAQFLLGRESVCLTSAGLSITAPGSPPG